MMTIQILDDFDPDLIADSGQCFRWVKKEECASTWRIIAGSRCLYLTALGDKWFELDCTEEEYEAFWKTYFDLDEDYREIRAGIDPARDPFLHRASEEEKGIRILRQDPWEMLITFIISQNRNIPAIRRSVEMLAERCGEKRTDERGETYYAFPAPQAVASLSEEELKGCKLGYRWKYVRAAAEAVRDGTIDLAGLTGAVEETTIRELCRIPGVGVKVANCVSLFGLHHVDAFPVDVWVRRILDREYPDGYPYEAYAPYNGVCQQYMFAYYREHYRQLQESKG